MGATAAGTFGGAGAAFGAVAMGSNPAGWAVFGAGLIGGALAGYGGAKAGEKIDEAIWSSEEDQRIHLYEFFGHTI